MKALQDVLNLKRIDQSFAEVYDNAGQKNILCVCPGGGEKIHIAASLDRPVIYVTKDSYSAQMAYVKLRGYLGDSVCVFQPNDDLLLYRKSFQRSFVGDRVKALYQFAKKQCMVLVTSSAALAQYVPKKSRLLNLVTSISVDEEIDIYAFIDSLVKLGYKREDACEEKNTFSAHGDIVDVFLSDMDLPIRISFFGDIVESIKTFDVDTMLSTTNLTNVMLYPNNDLLYTQEEIERGISEANKFIRKMKIDAASRADQIISELSLNSTCTQQMQWLLPFLNNANSTIFDYLDSKSTLIIDEPCQVFNLLRNYELENQSRVKDFVQSGEVTSLHIASILSETEIEKRIENVKTIAFSTIMSSSTLFKPELITHLNARKGQSYISKISLLENDIKSAMSAGEMFVICQPTKEKAQELQRSFDRGGIPCAYKEKITEIKTGTFIVPEDIIEGFIYPGIGLIVVGSEDLLKKSFSGYKKNNNKNAFLVPQVGEYVVHETHGIGKCLGIKRMNISGGEQDYIVVEYKNGGMLYLPPSQIDKLSRYAGSEIAPKLSSLGGDDFAKLKEKVKKSLKAMAIDLVSLYAQRQNVKGYKYSEDDYMMQEFEDSFEYELTEDQASAVIDIKEDMEKGVIMDRLLCGDVGYGKTEVAMRAIFKTILNGKQAAILAPTTILAQQHYRTAMERMAPFGVGIELVSRLKTTKEINTSLENIKTGKSQLIVATHRLLSKDVEFQDLGLLVLDEEQRFGVMHKEKLKVLKKNLNVLTLSATPIPRTLNMALIGVRDISTLETPPRNRMPVQTSVTELTPALLEDTIKREIARGGQVFILYNEVATIAKFTNEIQDLVPSAKVIYAHGQMQKEELEKRMDSFYAKDANVLVCTTIIENGIDIPDANTLIVCNADRLGLSQLYQLRGRVGRSNKLAYAFFTIMPGKVLTEDAAKRLNAIMDYTELGSGFKIAMRDLEIRGAGNILGREQHGHIEKVGYDMYCKLLQESMDEIKGIEKKEEINCQVNVEISAFLDQKYVNDDNSRIKILKDIIEIRTLDDRDALIKRLSESFGEVPMPLINLINISFVRNMAQTLSIEKITINSRGMGAVFANNGFIKNEKLMEAISSNMNEMVITNEEKPQLVFNCKKLNSSQKLDKIMNFLIKAGA